MQGFHKLAQYADALLGFGFLFAAAFYAFKGTPNYIFSGLFLLSSVISFISVKYKPSKWLARKILLMRLK